MGAWSSAPVLTYEQLKATERPGNNIGLRCGEPSKIGDNYLQVLDLDVRDPEFAKEAHAKILELVPEAGSMPTVISGRGGPNRHFYFVTDKPFRSRQLLHSKEKFVDAEGKSHWRWEIELFGTGKQVAIPPSIHPETGNPYTWKREFEPYFIPSDRVEGWGASADDIDDLLGEDPLRMVVNMQPLGLTPEEIHDTLEDLPLPEWCEDREGWLNVGMAIHHEFQGSAAGYELWCKFSKQSKKFKPANQLKVWESFGPKPRPFRFGTLIQAARLAREQVNLSAFDVAEDTGGEEKPARLSEREKKMLRMNKRHAAAFIGGKCVALTFFKNRIEFGPIGALHDLYANDRIATDRSSIPLSQWWMMQKGRRTYEGGVTFRPGQDIPEETFNLWRGFSVEPSAEGSCQRYLDHLFENICQRKQKDYDYLIGWLAHMIQKGWEKPGVALVFRGEKGVGKDVVPVHLSRLFSQHYMKVSQMDHLTGKFNAHLAQALLVHVEEGLWAGDKKAEGPLKSLITSETMAIERKNIDVIQVESCSRVVITSNEKWVIPATRGERRFAVFNVGKDHMQDRPYFRALAQEMEAGGYAKLLHYLQTYDISNFDVGRAPETEGLADQKVAGLKGHEAFWQEKLDEGEIEREHFDDGDWSTHPIFVPVDKFYARYEKWWSDRRHLGHGSIVGSVEFGRLLSEMCPSRERVHRGARVNRFTVHRFPSLPRCRAEFETYIGSAITWSEIPTDDDDDLL